MESKRKAADKILRQVLKIPTRAGSSTERLAHGPRCDGTHQAEMSQVNNALQKAVLDIPSTTSRQHHVYRVQGLPLDIDIKQAIDLISALFRQKGDDFMPQIKSFARAIDGCTMVATISFQTTPIELSGIGRNEWSYDMSNFLRTLQVEDEGNGRIQRKQILTIDDHFHGLTVLSSPFPSEHEVDCLAISGLGGHAFGSFKETDGSHMWLCDDLPYDLATTRIIIYGYESQLYGSKSFQGLEALASTLRTSLQDITERKPLFFIAHSLGGLIFKEAIIQMRDESQDGFDALNFIYGALFFGVPNQGMDITSLIPMVESQFNQTLLHSLSTTSDILLKQSRRFPEAFDFPESRIMCFYETVASPTAINIEGRWRMKGPDAILVGQASATHGRSWENKAHHIQAINRDHSQLVKFRANDEVYRKILVTLKEFSQQAFAMKRGGKIEAHELTADDTDCLKSLCFPEMRYRQDDVQETRGADSCGWILEHKAYQSWVNNNHGLLWIKGKPGSGKSTLMKRIHIEDTVKADIKLAFFFHRRGVQLQQTAIGMLRTLSHQLISQSVSARAIFNTRYNEKKAFGQHGKDWDWRDTELYQVLKSALAEATKAHSISIFIDALDEASGNSVQFSAAEPIVTYLHEVSEVLQGSASQTKICFSCRHYPIISRNSGFEICMENENQDDISDYIKREFSRRIHEDKRKSWIYDLKLLQSSISSGADGVFLWATLMVPLVAIKYNDGKGTKYILGMLRSLPPDLGSIYEHILKTLINDEDQEDSLHLMQWICLASRPLSLTDLRYALASDDLAIHEFQNSAQDSEGFVDDDAQMEQQITSLSGGLVEIRDYHNSKVVQFIHQSVNDTFLLKGGFKWLGLDDKVDAVGQGHHRLAKSCANFLKLGEVQEINPSQFMITDVSREWYPFLEYATKSWFLHAQIAESKGVLQTGLLQQFEWPDRRCPGLESTLLHTSAASNLQSIVKKLLTVTTASELDAGGNTPLHLAARFGYENVISMLLDAKANVQSQNGSGHTAIDRAALGGHVRCIELLLNRGADVNFSTRSGNALYSAASGGSYLATRMLLDSGAKINIQGGPYGNALQAAAYRGNEAVVRLLLDKGANVNAQGGEYVNALQAAAYQGNEAVVKLLLNKGAHVNAQGGRCGNALQAAAFGGNEVVVQLLLDKGADVNTQGGHLGNALQAAAFLGPEAIVKLLLNNGANVNAQGGHLGNALQAAASSGVEDIVKLLLNNGANVNAQGGKYGNALQAAARLGSETIVKLLLNKGANVNAQGGLYDNALQAADGHYGNDLRAATLQGLKTDKTEDIVKLLSDSGADMASASRRDAEFS
ncbi:hypothetical protein V502_07637 [Pseudogymnoascus sp. VKM F-4520 (FW-2644)]|nr:hypothetical protein V502_07637 [Pseudogymnoascus sp. VKM F-4520 (FW-2644)]